MELWRDIPWYDWSYMVSDGWKIMSLKKWRCDSKVWHIMKLWADGKWYLFTKLYKDWWFKNIKAHKAVMLAFVWEPNWLHVNHKDWNKRNNTLSNLEYCTISENIRHAFATWLNKASKSALWKVWKLNPTSKLVWRYSLEWCLIDSWYLYDYAKDFWYCRHSISKCCTWKIKSRYAYWFIWKYISNGDNNAAAQHDIQVVSETIDRFHEEMRKESRRMLGKTKLKG